jgi:hypothetical protein
MGVFLRSKPPGLVISRRAVHNKGAVAQMLSDSEGMALGKFFPKAQYSP